MLVFAVQAARPLIGYPLDDLKEEKEEPPPRSETTPPPAPRGGAPAVGDAPSPPTGVRACRRYRRRALASLLA